MIAISFPSCTRKMLPINPIGPLCKKVVTKSWEGMRREAIVSRSMSLKEGDIALTMHRKYCGIEREKIWCVRGEKGASIALRRSSKWILSVVDSETVCMIPGRRE